MPKKDNKILKCTQGQKNLSKNHLSFMHADTDSCFKKCMYAEIIQKIRLQQK